MHQDRLQRLAQVVTALTADNVDVPHHNDPAALGRLLATAVTELVEQGPHVASYSHAGLFGHTSDSFHYLLGGMSELNRLGHTAALLGIVEAYVTGLQRLAFINHLEVIGLDDHVNRLNQVVQELKTKPCRSHPDCDNAA